MYVLDEAGSMSKTYMPDEIHLAKNFTFKSNHISSSILAQMSGLLVPALKKCDLPKKAHILYDFLN